MAVQFIGMRMLVSLLDPPGTRLVGTVSDVKPGQSLSLQNVVTVGSNQHIGFLDLHATNILDIQQHQDADQPRTARAPAPAPAVVAPPPQPDILKAPLGDPAIVSVGRRPGSVPKPVMETSLHGVSEDARASHVRQAPLVKVESASRDTTPTAPPIARFQSLDISGVPGPSADSLRPTTVDDVNARTTSPKKKKRSGKKARIIPTEESIDSSPVAQSKQPGKGKGWRQTPMLQSTASFQPYNALKKDRRRRETNGWASEDATDVQEMGDFDFESSLAKFDKRGIFDQMRKDDQIDEADRLVSHNRLPRPKPGTAGGKNYHYSEMVLDPAPSSSKAREVSNDFWNSEADDSMVQDERHSGREQASSRTSRRGDSKMSSSRRSQSRKASTAASVGQGSINRVNSGLAMGSAKLSAQAISRFGFYVGNRRVETVSALQMLNLENIAHNEIGLTESIMTENAGRGIAEVVLLALADPAIRVRHPPAAVSGAAGSSGADTASPVSMAAANATVVVMAGNNKSGIRAVAAARHLRARGIGQVLLCVVGIERERDLLEDLRLQLRVYANLGGRVHSKIDLFEHLRKMDGGRGGRASGMASSSAIAGAGDASMGSGGGVTLIVDALLGLAVSFEELRTGDQATVYELMEWANRNEAFVLAVDVPTGIDPSSGKVAIIDGDRLYVRPRYVVALGAPKKGLAEALATAAMAAAARRAAARSSNPGSASSSEDAADDTEEGPRSGENLVGAGTSAVEAAAAAASMGIVPPVSGEEVVDAEDWKLYVADMGIGAAAWKKAGTKLRRGIEFGDRWVLEMQYRGPQERDIE